MTAQMPPEFIDNSTVADMLVGDTCYVVPWAVEVDENWACWIIGSHGTCSQPQGTANLRVTRESNGFVIRPQPEHRWRADASPRDDWLHVAEVAWL